MSMKMNIEELREMKDLAEDICGYLEEASNHVSYIIENLPTKEDLEEFIKELEKARDLLEEISEMRNDC